MANNIKCGVHDCQYWDNEICSASAIEVKVGDGSQVAGCERKTACHTYAKR